MQEEKIIFIFSTFRGDLDNKREIFSNALKDKASINFHIEKVRIYKDSMALTKKLANWSESLKQL